jgi:hypothetical protein
MGHPTLRAIWRKAALLFLPGAFQNPSLRCDSVETRHDYQGGNLAVHRAQMSRLLLRSTVRERPVTACDPWTYRSGHNSAPHLASGCAKPFLPRCTPRFSFAELHRHDLTFAGCSHLRAISHLIHTPWRRSFRRRHSRLAELVLLPVRFNAQIVKEFKLSETASSSPTTRQTAA